MADGLLRLLASGKNQAILGLLTIEPSYPRRLAEILELSEADVARRLRRMKDAGLVASEWSQVGQNVKMYRLVTDEFTIRLGANGLEVALEQKARSGPPVALTDPAPEQLPSNLLFVGRKNELKTLQNQGPVNIVLGLPGIGKSSLLAELAMRMADPGKVFWCGCRGVESFNWLAHRFALFFARNGDPRLLRAIEQEAEPAEKWSLMLKGMDHPGNHFIFDDAHRISDEAITRFLGDAASRLEHARLLFASREPVAIPPEPERVHTMRLEGLTDNGVKEYLKAQNMEAETDTVTGLRERLGGHPLALNLLVGAARAKQVPLERLLEEIPKDDLEEYLLREVNDTLKEDERRVLGLASLFRTLFTLDDLQSLTERPINGPLLRLRRRLLLDARNEGYYLHETLRTFFYGHLSDRPRLHQKVAERYLEAGTEEGRLEAMHHLLTAGRRDRVLEMMDETNLDLREFEKIDSKYHDLYYSVLGRFHREEVADDRRWALMEDERGDILFHRGELEQALEHYDEALEFFRSHKEKSWIADLCWKRTMTLIRLGRPKEAEAAREEGLEAAAKDSLARQRLEETDPVVPVPRAGGGTKRSAVK